MPAVLIDGTAFDKILDASQRDVKAWGMIDLDVFQNSKDKDFYNGVVNDQPELVDMIRTSGITLTLPPNFSATQIMTFADLQKNMLKLLKTYKTQLGSKSPDLDAITIPVAVTPSLWKRTRTGAVQMWQGVGLATASPLDWAEILTRVTSIIVQLKKHRGQQ